MMANTKTVTERDFRKPEFADAKIEDYEFRSDGSLVRKDRWEMAVRNIASMLRINTRSFEIDEVMDAIGALTEQKQTDIDIESGNW